MFNRFLPFGSKQPQESCWKAVQLEKLPGDMKRMLRIQFKTFICYAEFAESLFVRTDAIGFLERCLSLSRDFKS